jgi:predicted nucleic acid-binding protein
VKYVLDSCVAFKWVLTEPFSDKAQALRDEFRKGACELIVPDIFAVEVMHALTKAERQGRISPPQGGVLWADVMTTPPQSFPSFPLIPRAYQIASAARIAVYDCVYVGLAEREACELITADDKLVRTLRPSFPFITPLSFLP